MSGEGRLMPRWRRKAAEVEALQFTSWGMAVRIMERVSGVYYVPAGAEHPLRRRDEADPSNGNLYPEQAREFLAVRTPDGDYERADPSDWIIRGEDGVGSVCGGGPGGFVDMYESVDDPPDPNSLAEQAIRELRQMADADHRGNRSAESEEAHLFLKRIGRREA